MNSLEKLNQEIKETNRVKFEELTAEQREIHMWKMDLALSVYEGTLNDKSKIDKYLDVIETFRQLKKQVENEDYNFKFYDEKFEIISRSFNQFETHHIIEFTEDGYAMMGRAEHAKDYEQYTYHIDVEFSEKKIDTFENLLESIHVDVAHAFDIINQKKNELIERNQKNEMKTMEEPPTPPKPPTTNVDIPDF